jgi:hypothetical protein
MNGFAAHGIEHSSPSQINTWIGSPSRWVAQYLFDRRSGTNPAMARGHAVEAGVKAVIADGESIEDAIKAALADYERATLFKDAEERKKQGDAIPAMIEAAVDALAPFCVPEFAEDGSQHKISITAKGDGWELPVIGFLDFKFPDLGLVVDLKTTFRIPSEMSIEHQRQRAIYRRALGNYAVKFLYVSDKKTALLEDGDDDSIISEIKNHLIRQEAFLRLGDKELLRTVVPVDPSDFRWKGDEATRLELFGI